LVKNTTTAIGSESKFTLAEIYFKQNDWCCKREFTFWMMTYFKLNKR
jgi:hypothetical protein